MEVDVPPLKMKNVSPEMDTVESGRITKLYVTGALKERVELSNCRFRSRRKTAATGFSREA